MISIKMSAKECNAYDKALKEKIDDSPLAKSTFLIMNEIKLSDVLY